MKAMMNQVHLLAMVAIEIRSAMQLLCVSGISPAVFPNFSNNFSEFVGVVRPARSGGETYALAASDHDGDGTLDGTRNTRRKKERRGTIHTKKNNTIFFPFAASPSVGDLCLWSSVVAAPCVSFFCFSTQAWRALGLRRFSILMEIRAVK